MSRSICQWVRKGCLTFSALAMLVAGCTGRAATKAKYVPAFVPTDCPAEVSISNTRETKCGYLTVPENRSNPGGRQIRLFVFRIEPNIPTNAAPLVYVGNDVGSAFDYTATSYMADNLDGPEVIGIEQRGTSHSEPNLSCPEVEALSPQALITPIDDPSLRRSFVGAVRACHDRLTDQGIDLSSYGVEEAGADVVDLVAALRLTSWDLISKGSTSRVALQAMRTHPVGLQAVVLYHPEFSATDPFVQAFRSTRASVDHLSMLCEADTRCSGWFPDVARSVGQAIRRFDRHPVNVRISGAHVFVDGARLLRDLRNALASVHPDANTYLHLPATIDALAHAKDPTSSLAAIIAPEITAPLFCAGFLPTCSTVLYHGAYYSMLCRDIAPFSDPGALAAFSGSAQAWTDNYVHGPYGDVCRAWDVEPAVRSITDAVSSDVPILVYIGELDPFVSPRVVREGIGELPNAFTRSGSTQSHWVGLGQPPPCADDDSRNRFLADPTTQPKAVCQEQFQPTFVSSPL
jgi:pimeloyl-ACP methyl ester carboxylesterase